MAQPETISSPGLETGALLESRDLDAGALAARHFG
jgi:hypothetical protein